MKFCSNCGAKLKDEDAFCPECGAKSEVKIPQPVQPAQPIQTDSGSIEIGTNNSQPTPEPVQADSGSIQINTDYAQPAVAPATATAATSSAFLTKLKHVNKWVYIIGAAALAVIIAAIVIFVNLSHRINVNDYITVKFTGYDTVGKAECTLDSEKLIKDIFKKNGIKIKDDDDFYSIYKKGKKATKIYDALEDTKIDYKLNKTKKLSNGDTVKLTIDLDKKTNKNLGVKLIGKTEEFKVKGLKKAKKINPFDYIDISYDGTSPTAYLEITVKDDAPDFINEYDFKADKSDNIAKGDKITIKYKLDEDSVADEGYILGETKKEYKCEKIDTYIDDITQLSDSQLEELKKVATDEIEAHIASFSGDNAITCADLKYAGSYVQSRKKASSWDQNAVTIVYSANISSSTITPTVVYFPVEIDNVIVTADDKVSYDDYYYDIKGYTDLDTGSWTSLDGYTDGAQMYSDIITANKSKYNYKVEGDIKQFGE